MKILIFNKYYYDKIYEYFILLFNLFKIYLNKKHINKMQTVPIYNNTIRDGFAIQFFRFFLILLYFADS